MNSKVAFVIGSILKVFFKDGFIIYLILLPIGPLSNVRQTVLTNIPQHSLAVTLILGTIFAITNILYIGGSLWKNEKGKLGLLVGPWIDAFAFPVITLLIVVAKLEVSTFISMTAIVITVGITLLQILYNCSNFTKAPKSKNMFEHKEARWSILANFLQLCFLYFMVVKWVEQAAFFQQ